MNFEQIKTQSILVAQTRISDEMIALIDSAECVGDEKYVKGKLGDVYLQIYAPEVVCLGAEVIVRLEQKVGVGFAHKRIIVSTLEHKIKTFPELALIPVESAVVYAAIVVFIS